MMVVVETDMKLGTTRKITFLEAWRNLISTLGLTKVKLNYLLLSNARVTDERFTYHRQI